MSRRKTDFCDGQFFYERSAIRLDANLPWAYFRAYRCNAVGCPDSWAAVYGGSLYVEHYNEAMNKDIAGHFKATTQAIEYLDLGERTALAGWHFQLLP
jgi:hypothetical protein